jgi:hypothetical protein
MSNAINQTDAYISGQGTSPDLSNYVQKVAPVQQVATSLNAQSNPTNYQFLNLNPPNAGGGALNFWKGVLNDASIGGQPINFNFPLNCIVNNWINLQEGTASDLTKYPDKTTYKYFSRKNIVFSSPTLPDKIVNLDYLYDNLRNSTILQDEYGEFARIGSATSNILASAESFPLAIANSSTANSGATLVLSDYLWNLQVNTGQTNQYGCFINVPNTIGGASTFQASLFSQDSAGVLTCLAKGSLSVGAQAGNVFFIPWGSVLSNSQIKTGGLYWIYCSVGSGNTLAGMSGTINTSYPIGDAGLSLGGVTSALSLATGQTIPANSRLNGTNRIWFRIV